jgi:hypothetical protein
MKETKKTNPIFLMIAKNISIINTILLILSLCVSVFPTNYFGNDIDLIKTKVIPLLVIIATEFFVMTVGYFEKITNSTERLDKYVDKMTNVVYSTKPITLNKFEEAQNSIFISGAGMESLHSMSTYLTNVRKDVTITVAAADYDNQDVLNSIKHFFKLDDNQLISRRNLFMEGVNIVKKNREINVLKLNTFPTIAFFAIDYHQETAGSLIQAKHYLSSDNKNNLKELYCIAYPGTEIYKHYRELILLIENAQV